MDRKYIIGGLLFVGLIAFAYFSAPQDEVVNDLDLNSLYSPNADTTTPTTSPSMVNSETMEKPDLTIDESKTYTATLSTSEGDIVIELDSKRTPITANNFVYLAREGFYDGTIFHRVMKGFMIQGGDPNGNGTGGPGYRFDDEEAGLRSEYTRGTVAMANAGADTNGSQFFIMHDDFDLSPAYVIFGKVVEGMDVVDTIAESEVSVSPSGEMSKPVTPVQVETVSISEE